MSLTTFLKHIGTDDTGATAIEYGLILGLIAIAMVGALGGIANGTNANWNEVGTEVEDAMARN
ncbi:Flp family type IVb pilin [Erythrobacter rubeus]|uniref:Flp family type IVb pilin n=1 Tax=Erythrobacter rubeus TaxID=2760803 RepID=A0ABR8KRV0_9SPHN|nr:Flp family type IVb pilin [Erythrobacter rubeus]MBD2842060.1 Flp family type IVb pilin [Erythrobacter rubeus]